MVLEINNENLPNILTQKKITLLQFSAKWCGPCKMLSPIVDTLRVENEGKDISIYKIDIDDNQDLARKYNVRNIPTLLFLKGDNEVGRMVGMTAKSILQDKINELLE